ncbi:hypothetical protein [Pseudooceanicola pacificus]|uniref:hypothetical protein n=1 Tax=Pseudooceanicola pacificus TaxID=2676438 RepID=UPI001924CBE5|nr:hypothetical protein [Pseudooceanicola pacificus]
MIVIVALIAGAIFGGLRARARGGRRADILQYAAVYAMIFALAGLFATIFIHRATV